MTGPKKEVRGGVSGRGFAPRRTIYKGDKAPQMWIDFMAECKRFREERGMTARNVAMLMGVSVGIVSLWERGVSQPHPWDLTVYLQAIGASKLTISE